MKTDFLKNIFNIDDINQRIKELELKLEKIKRIESRLDKKKEKNDRR